MTTSETLRLVDAAIAEVRKAGREDLAEKLTERRDRLTSGAWHVLVAGEFKKGKSALVNGLLGVDICGVDPVAFTAVPTLIRHGGQPTAHAVPDTGNAPAAAPARIDIRRAADFGRRGVGADGRRLRSIEVTLPREVLSGGMVLVDTPGIGGGFAAAAAASTMRALALADGVIVVTDASQELTSAEVEFIQQAAAACPNLLVALTKTDFYPHWQRILDLDRQHLRRAGIDTEIVAVSANLRDLAVVTGDRALNAESGFPVLADRITTRLAARHVADSEATTMAAVRSALQQVADSLATEHAALTKPEERAATMRRVEQAQAKAKQLAGPSSRWLNTITDEFADIQSATDADLTERVRRLEADASRRIKEGDPAREWAELVPWMYRRTNEELTDAHARLVESIERLAERVAGVFDATKEEIGAVGSGEPAPSGEVKLDSLNRRGGKLEAGMHAARGWSLSSSVITTLLVTTLSPGLLVVLPVTAALGSVFAFKAVRSYKTTKLDQARSEATRSVTQYLHQARTDAARASSDLIRHSRIRIRDYYLDQASEMVSAAKHEQKAAERGANTDSGEVAARSRAAKADLDRVTALARQAQRVGRG